MTTGMAASGSMLGRISSASRRFPPSLWKTRAGRLAGFAFTKLGANPLVLVTNATGTFVVDARSRTESEMLWCGSYDADDVAFLQAATPSDGVFLDIGANVGLIFVPVWRSLTTGRAVAVEPVPVNFERLASACAANSDAPTRPTLLNLGLGLEAGVLTLVKEGGADTSDNAIPATSGQTGLDVPMDTLDATYADLDLNRLDTVKIDVEGFEWEVLTGGRAVIAEHRPIVYGEFNNRLMPLRGRSFRDVWAIFEPLGYRAFSFLDRMVLVEKRDPPADLGNAVLVPEEKLTWLRGRGVRVDLAS